MRNKCTEHSVTHRMCNYSTTRQPYSNDRMFILTTMISPDYVMHERQLYDHFISSVAKLLGKPDDRVGKCE